MVLQSFDHAVLVELITSDSNAVVMKRLSIFGATYLLLCLNMWVLVFMFKDHMVEEAFRGKRLLESFTTVGRQTSQMRQRNMERLYLRYLKASLL